MSETRVFLVSWDVERSQAYLLDLPDERLSLHEHMLFDGDSRLGQSFIPVWSSSEGPAPLNLHEVV